MKIRIEKQSDGSYIAYNTTGDEVQALGTGATIKEAKEDFYNTLEELKDSYTDLGEDIPECLIEDMEFQFDISSLFEFYSMLNASAFARYIGINDSLLRQYRSGAATLSDKQLKKIEAGIHKLGTELAALQLI